jgi:hypothetical protein
MKKWHGLVLGGAFALLICSGSSLAQPPAPKPGPEHDALKKFEGDWDATVSLMGTDSKAVASYRLGFGGFWLTEEFKGEFAGARFEGRGTTGYDPFKKKFTGFWIDNVNPSLFYVEGTLDQDGKVLTATGTGTGPDGKPMKMKNVYEFKDSDNFVFTMYNVTDGKEQEAFKITYQRKK